MQMRNITSKPRSCEIRALLACRDLREAPEHPLELWALLKSVATKRTERKKAAQKGTHARQKKEQVLCFCALNRTLANAEGTHARKN